LVSDVGVLEERVNAQHTIVGLNYGSRNLGTGPDSERDLRLLTIVDRQPLEHQTAKSRSSASTARVKDKETLETSTVIGELADSIQDKIDNFLANGIVTTGEVVSSVFLA